MTFSIHIDTLELQVFQLDIYHREGNMPEARIVVPVSDMPLEGLEGLIYTSSGRLIFKGTVLKAPLLKDEDVMELLMTAIPTDAGPQLQNQLKILDKAPWSDPLFIPDAQDLKVEDILDARPLLPHWSRVGEPLGFSNICVGEKSLDIGESYFKESIGITLSHVPIASIDVELQAEWIQSLSGMADLGPVIEKAFPEGCMETLTPDALSSTWFEAGSINRHYDLIKSDLEFVGYGGAYAAGHETIKGRICRPKVEILFRQAQKRRETVAFTMESALQDMGRPGRHHALTFKLEDITKDRSTPPWVPGASYTKGDQILYGGQCFKAQESHKASDSFLNQSHLWTPSLQDKSPLGNHASPTFFMSKRGLQALDHAILVAQTYLETSARAIEITFDMPLDQALDLDLAYQVHMDFKGQPIQGKVKAYHFLVSPTQAIARITLGACIGALNGPQAPIGYEDFSSQLPTHGLAGELEAQGLVRQVVVENDARTQAISLQHATSKSHGMAILDTIPTRVRVDLVDLTPVPCLNHHIQVVIRDKVLPPHHITF